METHQNRSRTGQDDPEHRFADHRKPLDRHRTVHALLGGEDSPDARRRKFGWERLGATDLVPAGHEIGEPELLFEKIEDDVIQKQLDKLAATKAANQGG